MVDHLVERLLGSISTTGGFVVFIILIVIAYFAVWALFFLDETAKRKKIISFPRRAHRQEPHQELRAK